MQVPLIVCHAARHLPGFAVEARARTGRLEALSRAATNRTFSALSLHATNIISTLISYHHRHRDLHYQYPDGRRRTFS
jgi:hypothetical protein